MLIYAITPPIKMDFSARRKAYDNLCYCYELEVFDEVFDGLACGLVSGGPYGQGTIFGET